MHYFWVVLFTLQNTANRNHSTYIISNNVKNLNLVKLYVHNNNKFIIIIIMFKRII
jgi:hypothetical protein